MVYPMDGLTQNEARVVNFILRHFHERHSINELGRQLNLSPRGIHQVLKRLEVKGAVFPEPIGNAIYYRPNLKDEIGRKMAELVLLQHELNSYAQVQARDFKRFEDVTQACVLFGSVLTNGRTAGDIDILLIAHKEDLDEIRTLLKSLQELKPKHIHDILMTESDLVKNIEKRDDVVLDIIKEGAVLWGAAIIVGAIRRGTS